MDEPTRRALEALASDARSGASELRPGAVEILRRAMDVDGRIDDVARAVGRAQPAMASIWNAALAALRQADRADGQALDRLERRGSRAPAALARVACEALRPAAGRTLSVATVSFSGSVLACLRGIAGVCHVRVRCAEGRPACEGRRMAEALAGDGLEVEFFTDAAIGFALEGGSQDDPIVLVGADAVTPAWIVNKVGTGMLAAAASRAGVPVFVAATRDKFVDRRVARLIDIVEHHPTEVWSDAPARVAVRNPYFERVPLDLVTGVLTDAGLLAGSMVDEACRAASADVTDADIARLREA